MATTISIFTRGLEKLLDSLPGRKITGQPYPGAVVVSVPIEAPDFFTWALLASAEAGKLAKDDIVVAVDWSSALAGIAAKHKGGKLVALFTSTERERGFLSQYSWEIEEMEKELAREADVVLCMTEEGKRTLETWGVEAILTENPGGVVEGLDA